MVAVCLLGSRAGLMGQPPGGLRGAMDESGASFNCLCSAGPTEPGALRASSLPTASLCMGCGLELSRHLGMPGPCGRDQNSPLLCLKVQGFPQGMVTATVGRGDTWPRVTSATLGKAKALLGQWSLMLQPPLSLISPLLEQLVLPEKLPNESTMQGLWKQCSKGRGLVLRTRPTGHNTCRTVEGLIPQRGKKRQESG